MPLKDNEIIPIFKNRSGQGGLDNKGFRNLKDELSAASIVDKNIDQTIPTAVGGLAGFTKMQMDFLDYDTTGQNVTDLPDASITAPDGATYIKISAHVTFSTQLNSDSACSIHLWRGFLDANITPYGTQAYATAVFRPDGTPRPTPEMHYHNRVAYPMRNDANDFTSILAHTPWIPICGKNEKWYLYAWQNTGADVVSSSNVENWLSCEFKYGTPYTP